MGTGGIQGTDSNPQRPFELKTSKGILWNTHTITPTTTSESNATSIPIACFKASSWTSWWYRALGYTKVPVNDHSYIYVNPKQLISDPKNSKITVAKAVVDIHNTFLKTVPSITSSHLEEAISLRRQPDTLDIALPKKLLDAQDSDKNYQSKAETEIMSFFNSYKDSEGEIQIDEIRIPEYINQLIISHPNSIEKIVNKYINSIKDCVSFIEKINASNPKIQSNIINFFYKKNNIKQTVTENFRLMHYKSKTFSNALKLIEKIDKKNEIQYIKINEFTGFVDIEKFAKKIESELTNLNDSEISDAIVILVKQQNISKTTQESLDKIIDHLSTTYDKNKVTPKIPSQDQIPQDQIRQAINSLNRTPFNESRIKNINKLSHHFSDSECAETLRIILKSQQNTNNYQIEIQPRKKDSEKTYIPIKRLVKNLFWQVCKIPQKKLNIAN